MSDAKIDPTSKALGVTTAALVAAIAYKKMQGEEPGPLWLAFSASALALVTYDRWYDGFWPFENEDAPGRVHYAQLNPG